MESHTIALIGRATVRSPAIPMESYRDVSLGNAIDYLKSFDPAAVARMPAPVTVVMGSGKSKRAKPIAIAAHQGA